MAVRDDWKLIGFVSVDAGLIHIGDPCYLNEEDGGSGSGDVIGLGRNYTRDWGKFCDWLQKAEDKNGNALMPHTGGNPGRAVIAGGFGGDGVYGVYARYKDGLTAQILIDFNYSEDSNEEEIEDAD